MTARMSDEEFADAVRFLETGMRPNEKATLRMCEEARRARASETEKARAISSLMLVNAAALDALAELVRVAVVDSGKGRDAEGYAAFDAARAILKQAGRR